MTDKTIPELAATSSIDENSLLIVDSGIETFKITAENIAVFFRDAVLPAGMTSAFAGLAAPAGWLLCDGAAVSRTAYLKLFTAIGTAHGIGNGSSTFNLPDLRGRYIAGKDDMGVGAANRLTIAGSGIVGTTLGASGGDELHTPAGVIGGSQSINHVHNIDHYHNMSHTHQHSHVHAFPHVHSWGAYINDGAFRTKDAASPSSTGITGSDHAYATAFTFTYGSGVSTFPGIVAKLSPSVTKDYYTSGVVSPPYGAGGSNSSTDTPNNSTTGLPTPETTGVPISSSSGGMSTNANVFGSNFTFTGTPATFVPPTLVLNYIIKT